LKANSRMLRWLRMRGPRGLGLEMWECRPFGNMSLPRPSTIANYRARTSTSRRRGRTRTNPFSMKITAPGLRIRHLREVLFPSSSPTSRARGIAAWTGHLGSQAPMAAVPTITLSCQPPCPREASSVGWSIPTRRHQ